MDLKNLLEIMAALRSANGCPWDKEQTQNSLRPFLIEETYELLEALEQGNPGLIKEELGDLLFQIVFHCQIAKERNEFDMSDVIAQISDKMIRRHPHVFAGADFKTKDDLSRHWEEEKKREGKHKDSILEGVPESMPSLLRAHKLQKKAAKVGFDWNRIEDVLAKLDEELMEFRDALKKKQKEDIEDELGDIFFVLVNISRFVGVNPEDALRKTISKFISRFRYIEMKAADINKELSEMTLEEMDALWNEAKEKKK